MTFSIDLKDTNASCSRSIGNEVECWSNSGRTFRSNYEGITSKSIESGTARGNLERSSAEGKSSINSKVTTYGNICCGCPTCTTIADTEYNFAGVRINN